MLSRLLFGKLHLPPTILFPSFICLTISAETRGRCYSSAQLGVPSLNFAGSLKCLCLVD